MIKKILVSLDGSKKFDSFKNMYYYIIVNNYSYV